MRQLSGLDAMFLYTEQPHVPNHVTSVLVYDPSSAPGGVVTFEQIMSNIARRVHLAPAFREKLRWVPFGVDRPYWTDDADFDLEFHVRRIALPKPGDWRQLSIQAASLHARGLDRSRPLWEMYVVEGLDDVAPLPHGSFAVILKIHHAAIDGLAGAKILSAIHDLTADAEPSVIADDTTSAPEPSAWELLARAGVNSVARPLHLARILGQAVPAVGRLPAQLRRKQLALPTLTVPGTRFNGRVSGHRVFEARHFDLADIKKIRTVVPGATVNDVALAVVGSTMRMYLSAKRDLPRDSLVAMVPISVRTGQDAEAAGNYVSAMNTPLGTDVDDPVERLAVIHKAARGSKEFMNAIGARSLTAVSQVLPSPLISLGSRAMGRFANPSRSGMLGNTIVTNVPGAHVPLYFAGARAVNIYGMGPILDGMGTMHIVGSYCGRFYVSVTACREMLPDPAFYGDCIEASVSDLMKASG